MVSNSFRQSSEFLRGAGSRTSALGARNAKHPRIARSHWIATRFLLSCVAASLLVCFGCVSNGLEVGIGRLNGKTTQATFRSLSQDGYIELANGTNVRLAGVRMRTPDETGEPDLLAVISDIISRESTTVEVERNPASNTAIVYYKQRIYYFDKYIAIKAIWSELTPYVYGTVNELVIVMAAARYDPTVGRLPEEARLACESADEKAQLALWCLYRDRPLRDYRSSPGQLYTDRHGYRARIAKADVPKRDRHLAEGDRRINALWLGGVKDGDVLPSTRDLTAALGDDNRIVRRHAAGILGKIGSDARQTPAVEALCIALNDEDHHVRAYAARSLGMIGDNNAVAALRRARRDRNADVRKAAARAIRLCK
jgi:HEAT repeats